MQKKNKSAETGARIKRERQRLGLTVAELAAKLDLTRGAVTNYESGIRIPDGPVLRKMAAVFDVDPEDMFGPGELDAPLSMPLQVATPVKIALTGFWDTA